MKNISTKIIMFLFNLKEYDFENKVTSRDVFIFHSKRELYEFFLSNGASFDKNLFDSTILFHLNNGDIISLAESSLNIIDYMKKVRKRCINRY